MRWLVAYDIVDDRRRARLARRLEAWGRRVQYSVFECELEPEEFRSLKKELDRCIDPGRDSLRFYPLCKGCLGRGHGYGRARSPESRQGYYLV